MLSARSDTFVCKIPLLARATIGNIIYKMHCIGVLYWEGIANKRQTSRVPASIRRLKRFCMRIPTGNCHSSSDILLVN